MNLSSPFGRGHCALNANDLSSEEKVWLGEQLVNHTFTNKELMSRFELPKSTLNSYAKRVREHKHINDGTGRLTKLTTERKYELQKFIENSKYNVRATTFENKTNELAKLSASDRNLSVEQVSKVSKSCLKSIKKEMDLKTGNAEASTNARIAAVSDVRSSVSFIVMNKIMVPLVNPELIINVDATSFTVGKDPNEKISIVFLKKPEKGPFQVEPVKDNNGSCKYSIKYYLMMTATGRSAKPIFIL
jgi:hypothetical protein